MLRHDDEVARTRRPIRVREWDRAGVDVSETPIERWQVRAQVDDVDIDLAAAAIAASRFDDVDESPAKAAALSRRVDRQHPKVSAIVLEFQVYRSGDRPNRILEHQKMSAVQHHLNNLVSARSIADLKERFDLEGVVDERGQPGRVLR